MSQNEPASLTAAKYARPAVDLSRKPPALEVRYFYASSLQIDDPLAPVPAPISNPSTAIHPLYPFSDRDNDALDKAWRTLRQELVKFRADRERFASTRTYSKNGMDSTSGFNDLGSKNRGRSGSARPLSRHEGQRSRPSSVEVAALSSSKNIEPHSMSRLEELRGGRNYHKLNSIHGHPMEREPSQHSDFEGESQGLTGKPFVRAPSRQQVPSLRPGSSSAAGDSRTGSREASDHEDGPAEEQLLPEPSVKVPVGTSRLHQVSMPNLRMGPIYWKPVHDEFDVFRATWFYKDTMLPVESEVANLLEKGYIELKPWTESWQDELNSAVEVGAAGEEKVAHSLWPELQHGKQTAQPKAAGNRALATEEEDAPEKRRQELHREICTIIDESTRGTDTDNKAAGFISGGTEPQKQLFPHSTAIYMNERDAVILRSNLGPSAYYNRRPYANYIRKGVKIGVPVVRGFDQDAYQHINKSKNVVTLPNLQNDVARQSEWQSFPSIPVDPSTSSNQISHVTDLVLVIHGIGQKLSERMESFHFTHSMNSFRREINVERCAATVRSHLRKELGGIMVLPVNWRSTLSLEDENYSDEIDDMTNSFSLQDITPNTLPSVRNIISDVMLDIPYYLSHHQPRMISAVIREANRIYELWCKNNPDFEKFGRVHLIAHSLGSVMALDILSKQPTNLDTMNGQHGDIFEQNHFSFDTKNLFLCGSPAGFFLLLKKATLVPRKDRNKPGSDGDDSMPGVAGARDTYGCLAVDNIYNIVNPYDPVAYQLNAAVDAQYAASLKPAVVPSATTSWFTWGRGFKNNPYSSTSWSQKARPTAATRLPSNVELETHNFTREEIAEKRAYLLNDNGQLDYFLKYGGGPLEIQYLTMLSAHSSYWLAKDFVRMLVVELGRRPGREGALEAMRATKKKSMPV